MKADPIADGERDGGADTETCTSGSGWRSVVVDMVDSGLMEDRVPWVRIGLVIPLSGFVSAGERPLRSQPLTARVVPLCEPAVSGL
ncbi:hypothetical protein GCM10007977_046820 [Dactylosporangium sucinum]|uniref:Uncharacterized protein n=1 Tax=Dactylosporangium sucinum TaxID=1424081 RepID=A0A917TVI7_9ACTN|nr:hypothetical protein GCM10007977_046820 [Dactylosporangium sucinum]